MTPGSAPNRRFQKPSLRTATWPPTAQSQAAVEDDLRRFVGDRLHLSDHQLTHDCEQAIRNYDPCISCATHFLDLTVDRSA